MPGRTLLLAVLLALASETAWAHSPYFSQIEKIDLPDGTRGELRLLYGDGIFFSDPVRIVAIDSKERLIARSERGEFAHIICAKPGSCLAYLHGRILELAPAINPGPAVSAALHQHGSPERYELEASEQSFGFIAREPRFGETLAANFGLMERFPLLPVLHAVLGALSALAIAGFAIAPLRRRRRLWIVLGISSALIAVSLLAAISFYLMLAVRLPASLWIGSVGFGFALIFALLALGRRTLRLA